MVMYIKKSKKRDPQENLNALYEAMVLNTLKSEIF